MAQVELLLDCRNIVGESLVWDERNGILYWVDIGGGDIHRLELSSGAHSTVRAPDRPTSVGLRVDGGFIVGLMKSVMLWDGGDGFQLLAEIEPHLPDNRLNEAQVAPDGSYWVGTMQNNLHIDGSPRAIHGERGQLWRVDPSGAVTLLSPDRFGITNTMIWTDNGHFVTADTMHNALFSYELRGGLGGRQEFPNAFDRGLPDGSTMDAEGFIWNCRVSGGGCIVRFAPDGTVDRVVELPCASPTSCTFGGADLDILFVTSARFGMTSAELDNSPQEGGLFMLHPDVPGRAARRVGKVS